MMTTMMNPMNTGVRHATIETEQARAAVLIYHRVAQLQPDPQLLCVSPKRFDGQMGRLRANFNVVSLEALADSLHAGRVIHRAVAITFDDGYVDNLRHAYPVLFRHRVPATVFVTSGFVGRNREFVSDVLERCLLYQRPLPRKLTLNIQGRKRTWKIDDFDPRQMNWDVTQPPASLRHQCYLSLHGMLRPLDAESRQKVLDGLCNWAGCPATARENRRVMTESELRRISSDGLITIGAHGVNHLVLAKQSHDVKRYEIRESKSRLESMLNRPVTQFAYSYGSTGDIDASARTLASEAGYAVSCANDDSAVTRESDPFLLPRVLVRDWSVDRFAERMREVFDES